MHILISVALASATPASAANATGVTTPAIAAKVVRASAKDKVICKTESMPGTRLADHVICGTRAQWDDYYDVVRQDFARVGQLNFGH